MKLTKDADKMICCIYKTFLQRRKSGISKSSAKQFSDDYFQSDKQFSSWLPDDLDDTLLEIGRAGLVAVSRQHPPTFLKVQMKLRHDTADIFAIQLVNTIFQINDYGF